MIFAAASFCDPALLDQPMLETALADAKIPFTSFKYAENTGQFQIIREQAGAFSDSVKLWGARMNTPPPRLAHHQTREQRRRSPKDASRFARRR